MTTQPGSFTQNPIHRLLSSKEAMQILGYRDRGSFWQLVYAQGIPHVRLNARVIKFPSAGLDDWIRRRGSDAA